MAAFDDEKQYLMGDVLCNWAIHQQKLTIATLWTQQQNYTALQAIDTQFEYFGELLEQTLNGLAYLAEQVRHLIFKKIFFLNNKFKHSTFSIQIEVLKSSYKESAILHIISCSIQLLSQNNLHPL